MRYLLSYSFGDDNDYTIELHTYREDLLGAVEEAIDYIEKKHTSVGALRLREFKISLSGGD